MARKRFTAEQIIIKLREAEVGLAQGQKVGRPRVTVDTEKIHSLRSKGLSLRAIAQHTGISHTKVAKFLKEG